ncbi:hypothetical protein NP856_16910 [Pseudomonas sp. 17391]|uniref:Glycosaminoglycan attachment site n=1 Tax=Pseudomonas urmiensis TaxID=2745493 RepID=A0ABW8NQV0_9PSED|nr:MULTISPECIES: hypothetical protein [Pseudomonas]MDD2130842.1 hypothetical protein [Pseudomonas sp. 17391]
MQELINQAVKRLIEIIDSKVSSQKVALQFVLEELDAARHGTEFVRDRIKSFYFKESDYVGAMERSWADVDGDSGPQQFLVRITTELFHALGGDVAAAVRISIVEYIIHHYRFGRYYIDQKVRVASKPLKLFEALACEESLLHPHYQYLLKSENAPLRDVVARWAGGFEDRDNKFNYEFQTTFNSSFWEIYLFQCFKDLDMPVDFSKSSPDFTVATPAGESLVIEAVTANHAHDSSPEWIAEDIKSDGDFLNFSCVRILNAIDAKHKKFLKSYSKLEHVKGRPFVVALAPFEQPKFFMQNNEAIIRVLYGQGIDKNNGFAEVSTPVALKNGSIPLDLGIFTSSKYKEVSALIFSTTATIGKVITQTSLPKDIRCSRYHEQRGLILELRDNATHFETHLDGLQVHHNPYAEYRLPEEAFDRYEITHYYYDVLSGTIDNQQKSYTLISRNPMPSSSAGDASVDGEGY